MIEIKNIVKTAGEKVILDDISLTIESGSFVVLIGPSGCGKTTTLKLLNKLIEPTSGEIYIDGKPISKEDPIKLRRNIGYVIQNIGLFPHLTIKENHVMGISTPLFASGSKGSHPAKTFIKKSRTPQSTTCIAVSFDGDWNIDFWLLIFGTIIVFVLNLLFMKRKDFLN